MNEYLFMEIYLSIHPSSDPAIVLIVMDGHGIHGMRIHGMEELINIR